jgi:hypothetical protein
MCWDSASLSCPRLEKPAKARAGNAGARRSRSRPQRSFDEDRRRLRWGGASRVSAVARLPPNPLDPSWGRVWHASVATDQHRTDPPEWPGNSTRLSRGSGATTAPRAPPWNERARRCFACSSTAGTRARPLLRACNVLDDSGEDRVAPCGAHIVPSRRESSAEPLGRAAHCLVCWATHGRAEDRRDGVAGVGQGAARIILCDADGRLTRSADDLSFWRCNNDRPIARRCLFHFRHNAARSRE